MKPTRSNGSAFLLSGIYHHPLPLLRELHERQVAGKRKARWRIAQRASLKREFDQSSVLGTVAATAELGSAISTGRPSSAATTSRTTSQSRRMLLTRSSRLSSALI